MQSGTPVMTTNVTSSDRIYYTPYIGNNLPAPNGSGGYSNVAFSEMSVNTAFSEFYGVGDIFAYYADSTWNICGAPWYPGGSFSSTSRGTGAGTTQLTQIGGILVNAYNLTCYNSDTDAYTISAQYGIYLGSFAGGGGLKVMFNPSAAPGGSQTGIGLWNAYNRVRITASSQDSNSSWTYSSSAWRNADDSTANSITWLDGLGQTSISAAYDATGSNSSASGQTNIGVGINDIVTPAINGQSSSTTPLSIHSATISPPILGLNVAQALERVPAGTETFYSGGLNLLTLDTEY